MAVSGRFAVPAVVLDSEFRHESIERVVIKSFGKGRIEERFVMAVVVGVGHRNDSRSLAAENCGKHFMHLGELSVQLVEQGVVVIGQCSFGAQSLWGIFDFA